MARTKSVDFLEFATTIYPQLKLGIKERTIESYVGVVNTYQRFLGKQIFVSELDEEMLVRYFYNRRKVVCVSVCTCNKDRSTLLALWEEAFEHNCHKRPPHRRRVKKMKEPKRIPTAWSTDEFERLLKQCKKSEPIPTRRYWTKNHFLGVQWVALLLTIFDTSHRIGTLLKLKRD